MAGPRSADVGAGDTASIHTPSRSVPWMTVVGRLLSSWMLRVLP